MSLAQFRARKCRHHVGQGLVAVGRGFAATVRLRCATQYRYLYSCAGRSHRDATSYCEYALRGNLKTISHGGILNANLTISAPGGETEEYLLNFGGCEWVSGKARDEVVLSPRQLILTLPPPKLIQTKWSVRGRFRGISLASLTRLLPVELAPEWERGISIRLRLRPYFNDSKYFLGVGVEAAEILVVRVCLSFCAVVSREGSRQRLPPPATSARKRSKTTLTLVAHHRFPVAVTLPASNKRAPKEPEKCKRRE
eukprot:657909-Pleurochrysis_carterae.AAC.3